ncbi:hypothetical protein DL770_004086 [Monosporascus sp. CRB-9-2]|nr:hypothetical protein DL770_004086 [Monosporascus sp. CRB-9-2]
MADVFGTNSSAPLEGLIGVNVFLDTFVVETKSSRHSSSRAYRGSGSPECRSPLVSPQPRSSDTPISVFSWRSSPYMQQPACHEQWDLLLELRNKTDQHYRAVREYLDQEACIALSDWLDGYPTPSHMREVGLLTLRDIDQDKPPASIRDSFAAALVQHSVFEIRRQRDYTASSSAFTEWGRILFSEVEWEQLNHIYEHLSSGCTSNNSPNVRNSPKPSSMADPSEHLGSGAQFDDQIFDRIGPPVPPQLSFPTFDMTTYDTPGLSMDPAYPEQASGRDHGLTPWFHETPHSTTLNQILPLLTLSPAAPNFSPLMVSGVQAELLRQISFGPALPDMVNNTRGSQPRPAGFEGVHSDRLCYKLKDSQSWATIMAYLDSFGSQNNLLDKFSTPSTDRPDQNHSRGTTSPSRVRADRFKGRVQFHLLDSSSRILTSDVEDAIVKGIESSAKIMLSIGSLSCLRHVENYLLSLSQAMISSGIYKQQHASRVLDGCLNLASMSDLASFLYPRGTQVDSYYSVQYKRSRLSGVMNGAQSDFDPTVILDTLHPRQRAWNTLTVPFTHGPSTSTSISHESDVSLTDFDEVASQDIGTASSYDGENSSISCPHCKRVYTGNSAPTSLLRHKRTKHGDGDMYRCPYCPKLQDRSDNLRVHIKNQHPGKKVPKGKAEFKALIDAIPK